MSLAVQVYKPKWLTEVPTRIKEFTVKLSKVLLIPYKHRYRLILVTQCAEIAVTLQQFTLRRSKNPYFHPPFLHLRQRIKRKITSNEKNSLPFFTS